MAGKVAAVSVVAVGLEAAVFVVAAVEGWESDGVWNWSAIAVALDELSDDEVSVVAVQSGHLDVVVLDEDETGRAQSGSDVADTVLDVLWDVVNDDLSAANTVAGV